jgi:RNA polymerase sigma-70 factor (ECF subfamily)
MAASACNLFPVGWYSSSEKATDGSGNNLTTKPVADEAVMLQVREGAVDMLGDLFDRYQVPLYNFYAKMTGDRVVSEDLVQEVFFRILKYRHTYRLGTPFRPWLFQIARNARIDHFRKQRPETELDPEMAAPPRVDSAQKKQETSLLHRALMQLPAEKRELLILCRFQELKYEEIARLLGCEVGTVKTRIHRALQELRVNFQELESAHSRPGNSAGAGRIPPAGSQS